VASVEPETPKGEVRSTEGRDAEGVEFESPKASRIKTPKGNGGGDYGVWWSVVRSPSATDDFTAL